MTLSRDWVSRFMARRNFENECALRAMLGMWVSELTPVMVMRGGYLVGLAAEEMSEIGAATHIIIPVEAVQ